MTPNKIGQKFGKLTCIEFVEKLKVGYEKYKFQCDCGNIVIRNFNDIRRTDRHLPAHCGCTIKEKHNNWNKKVGLRVNNITIIEYLGRKKTNPQFRYKCDCGNIKESSYQNILRTKSCGCQNLVKIGDIYQNYKILKVNKGNCIIECLVCHDERQLNTTGILNKRNNNCTCKTGHNIKNYEFKKELVYYKSYINSVKYRRFKEFTIEFEDFLKLCHSDCYYCGSKADSTKKGLHGLDRINSNYGYFIDNVVTCCYTCNIMKSDLTQENFYAHLNKIIKNKCDKDKYENNSK